MKTAPSGSYNLGDEILVICEEFKAGKITRAEAEFKIRDTYPPQSEETERRFRKKLRTWDTGTMGQKPFALIPEGARAWLDEIEGELNEMKRKNNE